MRCKMRHEYHGPCKQQAPKGLEHSGTVFPLGGAARKPPFYKEKQMNYADILDILQAGTSTTSLNYSASWTDEQEALHLEFELPGVEKDQIEIHVKDKAFQVKAPAREVPKGASRLGPVYKKKDAAFKVANLYDPEAMQVTYRDGILSLTIPKASEEKRGLVKITVE